MTVYECGVLVHCLCMRGYSIVCVNYPAYSMLPYAIRQLKYVFRCHPLTPTPDNVLVKTVVDLLYSLFIAVSTETIHHLHILAFRIR